MCLVQSQLWRGVTWGVMRIIESGDIWSQCNTTNVYWPSVGKAPHMAQWRLRRRRTYSLSSQFSSNPNSVLICSMTPNKSLSMLVPQFPHLSNVGTQAHVLSCPLQFSHGMRQWFHETLLLHLASSSFPGLFDGRKKNHTDSHMSWPTARS